MVEHKRFFTLFFLSITFAVSARHRSHHLHNTRHLLSFLNANNTFQVEGYLNFESNNNVYTTAHPSLLFRYTVFDRLEFRLGMDITTINDFTKHTTQTGISPLVPGIKLRFNQPKKFLPAFALTCSVAIPKAATDNLRQTYFAPSLFFSAEQDITSKLSFEYALALQWDPDNFQRMYFGSLNMEYDFVNATTFYSDFYVLKPEQDALDLRLDIGVNRTISKNIQFDFSTGAGLTKASPEFFFNAGFIFSYNGMNRKKAMHPKLKATR